MRLIFTLLCAAALSACVSAEEQARRQQNAAEAARQLRDAYYPAVPEIVNYCVERASGRDAAQSALRSAGFIDNPYSLRDGLMMRRTVGEQETFITLTPRSDGCSVFVLGAAVPMASHREAVRAALSDQGFEISATGNTEVGQTVQKVVTTVLFGTSISTTNFQTAKRGDLSLELSNTVAANGYDEVIILTPVEGDAVRTEGQ